MDSIVVLERPGEGLSRSVFERAHDALGKRMPELLVPGADYAGRAIACGVAIVSPRYKGHAPVSCDVLVMPEDFRHGQNAREIVTYGMGPRATLSFSSIGERRSMIEIRRKVTTLGGELIEECEYPAVSRSDTNAALAEHGALLALGICPPCAAYSVTSSLYY